MLTRRDFIRVTGAGVAAGATLSRIPWVHAEKPLFNQPGRIVQVSNPNALKRKWLPNDEVCRKMVDKALMALTGESSPVAAIKRFIRPDDVVGVHPNCLGSPRMSAQKPITFRIIELLKEAGIPGNKIFVYDQYGSRMRGSGYRLGKQKDGVTIGYHGTFGLRAKPTKIPGIGETKLAKMVDMVTAMINIVVPKDHDLAGVTGALKLSAFGNIEYVPKFHRVIHKAIPAIYNLPEIKNKVRLNVLDATRVLYHRGPQDNEKYKAPYNAVFASTDPVTTDMVILQIVDEFRAKKRLKKVVDHKPGTRKSHSHILNAAELGLGVADMSKKIKWEKPP